MIVPSTGRFGRGDALDGRWSTVERQDTPLLVCLHGACYDSRYFDAPGCSLLAQAGVAGFPAVALTRPGCPATEDSARGQPSFADAARIIADAISDAWDKLGANRPGVVLVGHSVGAAIGVHVAAQQPSWPLLGLAISGVGDTLSPAVLEAFAQLPTELAMNLSLDVLRPLLYGPDWTLKATTLADVADLVVATPSRDVVEVMTRWIDDLPKVAASVEVPVHCVLAEFDGLWVVSAERVDGFARHFCRAPYLEASLWRCAGHNVEHHRLGEAYIRDVLAFAERCAMETYRPEHT